MTARPWDSLGEWVQFSAKRGDEDLHVQVIAGMEHPSGNPQLMCVALEVRLGPDLPSHEPSREDPETAC